MSSSPKSSAKLMGVTVAGMPILTPRSHFASNITETISALPEKREQFTQIEEINILIKFTFYCLQNSHDFFLAGRWGERGVNSFYSAAFWVSLQHRA